MAMKPPRDPRDIEGALVQDLAAGLGTDLLSAAFYGSAVGERYRPGESDINLLVVVADVARRPASRLIPFVGKWAPARVTVPLLLTPSYIEDSLDAFPLELLVLARFHRIIHGPDPFQNLDLEHRHLRLQLEREMRAKLLALNTRLMASQAEPEALGSLVRDALPAFTAMFQGYLHLKGLPFPEDPGAVMAEAHKAGLPVESFQALMRVRRGEEKPKASGLVSLLEDSIEDLGRMCALVDRM